MDDHRHHHASWDDDNHDRHNLVHHSRPMSRVGALLLKGEPTEPKTIEDEAKALAESMPKDEKED